PAGARAPRQHLHWSPSLRGGWDGPLGLPPRGHHDRMPGYRNAAPKVHADAGLSRVFPAFDPVFPGGSGGRFSAGAAGGLLALVRLQQALAQPDGRGRDLDQLVLGDELQRGLERHLARRLEDHGLVGAGRADVGELLALADVDLHVAGARVLAHDHALVDLDARPDEQGAALLEVEQRVGDGGGVRHGDHDAALAAAHVTGPGTVPVEPVVQHAFAPRVGQELVAVAEQRAGRDAVDEPHQAGARAAAGARAPHLEHLALALPQLLDDDADEVLGHVDRDLLVGLEQLAVRPAPRDDAR